MDAALWGKGKLLTVLGIGNMRSSIPGLALVICQDSQPF
jgi:hypothetical protein